MTQLLNAPGRLRTLDPSRPATEGLIAAFDGVLFHAVRQVCEVPRTPPKVALHEYRKSIRRARSLLKLVEIHLDGSAYAELSERMRRAVRETSELRDVDVLANGATRLLEAEGRGTLVHLLRTQQDTRRTIDTLQGELGWLGPVRGLFADHLPDLSWEDLHTALKASLRKARNARRRVRKKGDTASVHAWRKRVKELRYQLELFGDDTREYRRLSKLAEELGTITDLVALKAQVRRHRDRLPARGKKFARDLDRKVNRRMQRALRRSRRIFKNPSKALARTSPKVHA